MNEKTTRGRARGGRRRIPLTVKWLAPLAVLGLLALWIPTTDAWVAVRAQMRAASWEKEEPRGPDNITPRMEAVRDAVKKEFGIKGDLGCYREDGGIAGGGEHPLGRACDVMLVDAGGKATGEDLELGRRIVEWVRENADEYGIWYVIHEQRIWSSRWPLKGNAPMEDRGSNTLNHYDHVHISVY
ncbi:hypothetical protein GCM10010406_46440 [Streptomyces thermolineatus]|uniref:ARB-07466-like C-terminal domain-containing protein n=1 Tax=Streptomyces thermolineatus TaxID=44033 RepID=A0ABN3MM38_9ACTN